MNESIDNHPRRSLQNQISPEDHLEVYRESSHRFISDLRRFRKRDWLVGAIFSGLADVVVLAEKSIEVVTGVRATVRGLREGMGKGLRGEEINISEER